MLKANKTNLDKRVNNIILQTDHLLSLSMKANSSASAEPADSLKTLLLHFLIFLPSITLAAQLKGKLLY